MDVFLALDELWLTRLAWLVGLAVPLAVLTRLMPCNPGMAWWKDPRGFVTDMVYWFFAPVFLRLGFVVLLYAGGALVWGGKAPNVPLIQGLGAWQQCLAVLVLQDVMLYWIHRGFHTRTAWSIHAIHHSPRVLDWTAMARFHPVNHLLEFGVADVAVILMGFSPMAIVVLAPFNGVFSALVHANLNWTFGPLRYLLASPVFHRWHHTTQVAGRDKNFASTFSVLDVVFGTFYMPANELPEAYGVDDAEFPRGFWGQMMYPLRRERAMASEIGTVLASMAGGDQPAICGRVGGGDEDDSRAHSQVERSKVA